MPSTGQWSGLRPDPARKPQRSAGRRPSTERVSTGLAIDASGVKQAPLEAAESGPLGPYPAASRALRPGGSAPLASGEGRGGVVSLPDVTSRRPGGDQFPKPKKVRVTKKRK